jgi:hypothetical protein
MMDLISPFAMVLRMLIYACVWGRRDFGIMLLMKARYSIMSVNPLEENYMKAEMRKFSWSAGGT